MQNTMELRNFEDNFLTFFEKRYKNGEEVAYEYLKSFDPDTYKNKLLPRYLEKWLADLEERNLGFRMKFFAVQDFIRFRWMAFQLILYQSMREKSATGVDLVAYSCETLKEDMIEYYRISQKFLRHKITRRLQGLYLGHRHSYNPHWDFDQRKFVEEQQGIFEHYQISKIKVNCCIEKRSQHKYMMINMQMTFQHRAYRTEIQTPVYGNANCSCKNEKKEFVFEFKPEEYITQLGGVAFFGFVTNLGNSFPPPEANNKFSDLGGQEVVGFYLGQDDGHIYPPEVYLRERKEIEVAKVERGSLRRINFDFKNDPWIERDRIADVFLDAGMQDYLVSLEFDANGQSEVSWQALQCFRNSISSRFLKELSIVSPETRYNINMKEWLASFVENPVLNKLRVLLTKKDMLKEMIPMLQRISQLYPNLMEYNLESEIYSPFDEKCIPDLATSISALTHPMEYVKLTLYMTNLTQEKLHSLFVAFENLNATYVTLCIFCKSQELNEDEEKKIFKTHCKKAKDPSLKIFK